MPAEKAHPGILVAQLDDLAARLESRGIDVSWDENFPGYRRIFTFDNNGNRLEFLTQSLIDEHHFPGSESLNP